jgi:hypothetical protein
MKKSQNRLNNDANTHEWTQTFKSPVIHACAPVCPPIAVSCRSMLRPMPRLQYCGNSSDAGVGIFAAGGLNSTPCARRPLPELSPPPLLLLLRESAEPVGERDLVGPSGPSCLGMAFVAPIWEFEPVGETCSHLEICGEEIGVFLDAFLEADGTPARQGGSVRVYLSMTRTGSFRMAPWPHLPNLATPRFFPPLPRVLTCVGALTFGVALGGQGSRSERKKKSSHLPWAKKKTPG